MSNEKKEKIEQINQDTPVLPQNINEAKDTTVDLPVSLPKNPNGETLSE